MPQTLADVFFKPIEAPTIRVPGDAMEAQPSDRFPVGSSPWWIGRLHHELRDRNVRLARLRGYYEGTNETWRFANEAHRETFGTRFQNLRANYARPIVEIPAQRMAVVAISLGTDDAGSDEAWRIWQANRLDARSLTAHLDVLSVGECPVLVGPNAADPRTPIISVEDPLQVIVERDPADPSRIVAGLKLWEKDERHMAVLYLPDRIEWWEAAKPQAGKPLEWSQVPDKVQQNPWGVVPIAVLHNAPECRAEHEDVLDQLDLYAKTLYDMATASDYMASPQRWATGVTIADEGRPTDDQGDPTGSDAPAFQGGPNRVWTSEDPDSTFGQLPAADLTAFVRQLEAYRSDMATITHTPHRLLIPPPSSVPPSGESVRLSDAPLTAKVEWKITAIGNGWEDVMRLAFLVAGDRVRAAAMDMEALWKDPELRTEVEHVDALSKMAAMGVPQEEIWRRMGATPQQIRRWKAMQPATPPAAPAPTSGGSPS
jgi:hypothetical protein